MTARGRFSSSSARATGLEKDHYRIVVLGASGVGKSAIINQFLYDQFCAEYTATVEEMHRGEYEIDGMPLVLDILDTCGSGEFPAMRHLSLVNGDAFVLVYSVDNSDSFDEVKRLREEIVAAKKKATDIPMVVVGNKVDLNCERTISKEAADVIANVEWGSGYVESSAKDNVNIVGIFKELLAQAHADIPLSPAVKRRRESTPVVDSNGKIVRKASIKQSKECIIS